MKISKAEARGSSPRFGAGPKTAVRESAGERSPGERTNVVRSRPPGSLTTSREHPILFSAEMVRAILSGRKTVTRRLVTWQGPKGHPHYFDRAFTDRPAGPRRLCVPHHHPEDRDAGEDNPCHRHYPRWGAGDRLWVREAWASSYARGCWGTIFSADGAFVQGKRRHEKGPHYNAVDRPPMKWRPSIFMPRWASRITLEVTTEPEPQRLHDISDEDVVAEGLDLINGDRRKQDAYAELWDRINGKTSPWSENSWVWAIHFRVLP